jgi:hypothetical protein
VRRKLEKKCPGRTFAGTEVQQDFQVLLASRQKRAWKKEVPSREGYSDGFITAKIKEISGFINPQDPCVVAVPIAEATGKVIPMRFVLTWKECRHEDTNEIYFKPKARLVVIGCQDPEKATVDVSSSTPARELLKVLLHTFVQRQEIPQKWDAGQAHLHSGRMRPYTRKVFLRPPAEANVPAGYCWRALRAVYGLGDAPAEWAVEAFERFMAKKFTQAGSDSCLFVLHRTIPKVIREADLPALADADPPDNTGPETYCGALTIHGDDLLWAGNSLMHFMMDSLRAELNITSREVPPFTILGVDCAISRKGNAPWGIRLSQKRYALTIARLVVSRARGRDLDVAATEEELELFRAAVGCLTWLAANTRPDLAFYSSSLASRIASLTVRHLKVADKAVRQAHDHAGVEVYLQHLNCKESLLPTLVAFGDSSLAGEPETDCDGSDNEGDTGTQQGLIICACPDVSSIERLGDKFLPLNPLYWRSAKCPRSVISTFGAEIIILHDALDRGIGIAQHFDDLCGWIPLPLIPPVPVLYGLTDGDSGVSHLMGNRVAGTERRLRGFASSIRNSLRFREVQEVAHLPGVIQMADDFTKNTGSPQLLEMLTLGGTTLQHEKAWVRIKRPPELSSRYFERAFLRLQLAGTLRGEYLSKKLSILPLPPKTRAPGKPKAPVC